MNKSKITIYLLPGDCCMVVPVEWARHVVASYRKMATDAETPQDANAYKTFADEVEEWIEQTAMEFGE